MGAAAPATSSPNRATAAADGARPCSQPPPAASSPARNSSAARARSGTGPAEPTAAPTERRAGCSASANEHTAITMALRVPTLANCCGPSAGGTWNAAISSSGARTDRFGPVKYSVTGTSRVPRTDASSTSASPASSGGCASPAGEADPRFPPTVPRLRICGDPTVREAMASPGSRSPSRSMRTEYGTTAPTRSRPSTVSQPVSSAGRVTSSSAPGRVRSKLTSTMTSVPPAIGTASGRSAMAARASAQVAGRRKSILGPFP